MFSPSICERAGKFKVFRETTKIKAIYPAGPNDVKFRVDVDFRDRVALVGTPKNAGPLDKKSP